MNLREVLSVVVTDKWSDKDGEWSVSLYKFPKSAVRNQFYRVVRTCKSADGFEVSRAKTESVTLENAYHRFRWLRGDFN